MPVWERAGPAPGSGLPALDELRPLGSIGELLGVDRLRGPVGSAMALSVRRPATGEHFRVVVERVRVVP